MPDDAKDVVAEWRTGRGAGLGIVDMYGTGDDLCAEVERLRLANKRLWEALKAIADDPHCIYPVIAAASSDHDHGYQIGVVDGHRCAAMKARTALEESEKE